MATNQNPNQNRNQNQDQQSKQNMNQGQGQKQGQQGFSRDMDQQQNQDQIGNRNGQSIPADERSNKQDTTVMKNANPKKVDQQLQGQDEYSEGKEALMNDDDMGGKNPKENSH